MSDDFFSKLGRLRKPSAPRASAVDRLIELAADAKPSAGPSSVGEIVALSDLGTEKPAEVTKAMEEVSHIEPKDADESAMWKVFLQFKSVLPYVSRLLPLLDIGLGHVQQQNSGVSQEMRQGVTSIQMAQRETRVTLQDQGVQLKRVEDQLTRMREASEKNAFEHAELVEDVKSLTSLVRVVGAGLAILLVVLILMVGALLTHVSH
ncbi:hypothetical protein [Silvibacterium acidisoli]|uniref:hypothetical protein n=1 Tax=Acidobacteriaceae bacterium ZG23-2 TaxID=2883246 RepID=UPI00406C0C64